MEALLYMSLWIGGILMGMALMRWPIKRKAVQPLLEIGQEIEFQHPSGDVNPYVVVQISQARGEVMVELRDLTSYMERRMGP